MHKEINNLTNEFKPRLSTIKDTNGTPLNDPEKIADRWAEYCKEMYDGNANTLPMMEPNGDELPPLRSEVEWAIKQLPTGK